MTSTCLAKGPEDSKSRFNVGGGPLMVTDEAEDALIHNRLAGARACSAENWSKAARALFSSAFTIDDHDVLPDWQ